MPKIDTLTLQPAHRTDGGGRTAREYRDIYISGVRLLDLLGWSGSDYITPFGWGHIEWQKEALGELLLKRTPSLSTGRCRLYVCPECGDIGCGAITVRVEREDKLIVWRDFGYENDYGDDMPQLDEFAGIGPLYFEATDYWRVLSAFQPAVM